MGIDQTAPGTTNGVVVADASAASGGMNVTQLISAASTNAYALKGASGRLYGFFFVNTSASTKYVKLFNKASAPVVGTDAPALTIPVPTGPATQIVLGDLGTFFAGIAITGGGATSDATAVAANDIIGFTLTK